MEMVTRRKPVRPFAMGGAADEISDKVNNTDIAARDTDSLVPASVTPSAPSSGPQSFSSAFRAARGAGLKKFTWNGKSYTTELAGAKPAAPAARAPTKPTATPAKATPAPEKPKPAFPGSMNKPTLKDTSGVPKMLSRFSGTTPPKEAPKKSSPAAGPKTGVRPRQMSDSRLGGAPKKAMTSEQRETAKNKRVADASLKGRARMPDTKYAKGGSIDGLACKGRTRSKGSR